LLLTTSLGVSVLVSLGSSTFGTSGFLGSSTLVFLTVRTPPFVVTLTVNTSSVALYPFGATISVTLYSPSSNLSDRATPLSFDVSSKLLPSFSILNLAPARPFPVLESTFLILSLP